MPVIYSPEVNAFAKLRSRLHFITLEMTLESENKL